VRLNTIVRLPDGREGTICYHNLDGDGGVWGRQAFEMPETGFGDTLPKPEFMLRDPTLQGRVGCDTAECVGDKYEVLGFEPLSLTDELLAIVAPTGGDGYGSTR
jgi:hypothetical protein